jgi:hypothetical protein
MAGIGNFQFAGEALAADLTRLKLLAFAAGHHGGAVIALAVPDKTEAPAVAEFVLGVGDYGADLPAAAACDGALRRLC